MSAQDRAHRQPHTTDRRGFVKATGALAGVLAAGVPKVHAAEDSTIRVGLIGCGGRGSGAAVNAMTADSQVKIVALADLFDTSIATCRKSLSRRFKEQFDVSDENCFVGIDAYKELLAADVDVVLLATPPYYRPEHIEAAVEAGKEIFCEKPVASDPTGVARVRKACEAADEKGLNVVSGLCWRYDKGMQESIQHLHEGRIGTILSTQADYLAGPVWTKSRNLDETDLQYQCRNWYNYTWLSGDHIVEQFIHSLDKALWLHHDIPPVKAYGLGGRQNREGEPTGNIYDHFAVVYQWEDNTRTHANTRQIKGCFNQTEDYIYGTEGMAMLCKHRIEGTNPWEFKGDKVQMHQAEQNEFFSAIRGNRERINNGSYMCDSTLMAILGREVCYSGRQTTFEEIKNSPQQLGPQDWSGGLDGEAPPIEVAMPGKYRTPLRT